MKTSERIEWCVAKIFKWSSECGFEDLLYFWFSRNIDDDDVDDMEASFSQMQKEETISARIGLMEDLADIKREEEEKKRKKMMKKRN